MLRRAGARTILIMTLPAITWLMYAVPAYVLYTVVFRLRYGRSAVAERFPPRDLYGWIDYGLAACLISYSCWIVFGVSRAEAISVAAGVGFWALGAMLRIWAVWALGRNWRIGQDDNDTTEFVRTGPYRFMHHPINSALVLVAIGQAFMTGLDARAMFLLGFSVAYLLIQASAEKRYWQRRAQANTASVNEPSPTEGVSV